MSKEIWKQIEWSEYSISTKGRCKSHKGNLLKPILCTQWLYAYRIIVNWKWLTKKIHRLVATAFIENLTDNMTIYYLDWDKTNNNLENLGVRDMRKLKEIREENNKFNQKLIKERQKERQILRKIKEKNQEKIRNIKKQEKLEKRNIELEIIRKEHLKRKKEVEKKKNRKILVTSDKWLKKIFNNRNEVAEFFWIKHINQVNVYMYECKRRTYNDWQTIHKCKIEYQKKSFFDKIKDLFN